MLFQVHLKTNFGLSLRTKLEASDEMREDMKELTIFFGLNNGSELPLKCLITDIKAGNIYCVIDDESNDRLKEVFKKEDYTPQLTVIKDGKPSN